MEKQHKIIIAGLVIVIIALVASLAFMLSGNNFHIGEATASEGMQRYNFDSAFTMEVPKGIKFLKDFNSSIEGFNFYGVSYFSKKNEIAVSYVNSPIVTHEFIGNLLNLANASGNLTYEHDGDLIILHNKNNGKMGKTLENSNFTEAVLIQRGHELVIINGNDLDSIKSMIKTLEWYE